MKTLLVLTILSLSIYSHAAEELICNTDKKVAPVIYVHKLQDKLSMVYTRTDNTLFHVDLEVEEKSGNEYSGTIWHSQYGDALAQGSYKLSLPETYGKGSLTYQFNSAKSSTVVELSCTGPDNR